MDVLILWSIPHLETARINSYPILPNNRLSIHIVIVTHATYMVTGLLKYNLWCLTKTQQYAHENTFSVLLKPKILA